MSYYKNHKKKAVQVHQSVTKHIKESKFNYDMIDLETALNEAKTHYNNYIEMQKNDKFKPIIENKSYK